MKKAKLKLQTTVVNFDISDLSLRRKGSIYTSENRTVREFTLLGEPIMFRIELESIQEIPMDFRSNSQTILDFIAKKYVEEDTLVTTKDVKEIICESDYCYLPIESFDKTDRMILFCQIVTLDKYLLLNVSGYDYEDGTKVSNFEKLYDLGKRMMTTLVIQ